MAETGKTTANKTTTVKQENATVQSPTGTTTKVESKTTTTTTPTDVKTVDKKALDARMKKILNISSFGSSVGFVAGLSYSFVKKKGFWSYVGYSILGSLVVGTVANLGARAILKPETEKK